MGLSDLFSAGQKKAGEYLDKLETEKERMQDFSDEKLIKVVKTRSGATGHAARAILKERGRL